MIEPSVGSIGGSYDYLLAETVNGPYKAEVIHRHEPWRSFKAVVAPAMPCLRAQARRIMGTSRTVAIWCSTH
jgi:hypothetical protein